MAENELTGAEDCRDNMRNNRVEFREPAYPVRLVGLCNIKCRFMVMAGWDSILRNVHHSFT